MAQILLSLLIVIVCCLPVRAQEQKRDEYQAPAWARTVVWYQIFPERFRNGDLGNDPRREDIRGSWPHDDTSPWQVHPWGSDWYELLAYEKETGKNIWFNLQRRRYGGDVQGILDKLDYLKELGIGAIYLNPVFTAPSLHKYDGATYHHIDPNFGPDASGDRALIAAETPDDAKTWVWTAADRLMLRLIAEIHRRGMKVIFDGVFNHMGLNSWAFQDVVNKQQNSKYRDWFSVKTWDNPATGEKFSYDGWFGVKELPELREDDNGIVAGPRDYIFACTRRWMDPNGDGNPQDGIDGWRLDVAFCVRHEFWKNWRKLVKSINAEAYLTAEVIDKIEVVKPYLEGDEFDAVMNYNFAFTAAEFFIQQKYGITASEMDKTLRELRQAFHPAMAYVMQNLFDSHDTHRLASHIVNRDIGRYRDWGDFFGKSQATNTHYDVRKPTAEERRVQKLMVLFQMTYVGAPMVYYGDEVGMWGANDPCCRKPMVWDDVEYRDEVFRPDGSRRTPPDKVMVDKELLAHYRQLIRLRNAHPALQTGDYRTVLVDDEHRLFAFARSHAEETLLIVINNSQQAQQVQLMGVTNGAWKELRRDEKIVVSDNTLSFVVPALDGGIWVSVPAKK